MIGIFDSGSGGLSVLKEIRKIAPKADIVYFGDFANLPYGEKTPEELGALTVIAIEKLLDEGATDIVSACNSVSASVAQPIISLLGRKPFSIIEMIGPTVEEISKENSKNILVVSTEATKKTGIYTNAFKREGVDIVSVAIPDLVGAIERDENFEIVEKIIFKALSSVSTEYETLVLGCTQFPLAEKVFRKIAGDGVAVFNPAKPVAVKVKNNFDVRGKGVMKFILSKESNFFREIVDKEFPDSVIEVM